MQFGSSIKSLQVSMGGIKSFKLATVIHQNPLFVKRKRKNVHHTHLQPKCAILATPSLCNSQLGRF